MDPEEQIKQLTEQLETATKHVTDLAAKMVDGASAADLKLVSDELEAAKAQIATLEAERTAAQNAVEVKRLRADMDTLINQRTASKHLYNVPNVNIGAAMDEPLTVKLWKARRGDQTARQQMHDIATKAYSGSVSGMKALGEGTQAAGGYLVPPAFLQDAIALLRRANAPMLDVINMIRGVSSNLIYIPQQTGISAVAWTADNATKTSTDEVFAQIAVNIFTLAGIAKVSNQLLEDSSPAVDQLVKSDLGRGLNIELDRAVLNGSGTGQPTGILNTAGVTTTVASAQTAASIFDDIFAGLGRFQQTYYGQPDFIAMAPRTYTKMLTAKDTAGRYLAQSSLVGNQGLQVDASPSGAIGGSMATFAGIHLVIDPNMPVAQTVGANTNRSSIILGASSELMGFMRDEIRMDVSSEAGTSFEQNQTWFRGECRFGFTAARLTAAIQIVSDVGP